MANILIIDDDEFYRQFLVTAISRHGHSAYQLASLVDAKDCIRRWGIDLVIADVFVPQGDSLEIVRALKETYPRIPVIALTEEVIHSRELYAQVARRSGAVRAFSKTINPSSLMEGIREFLPAAAASRAAGGAP